MPVEVRVTRTGGFTGPSRFELPSLPSGVTAYIRRYAATSDRFYIALTPRRPRCRARSFGVTGVAEIDGKPVSHTATGSERVWKTSPLHAVATKLMDVGVCEPPTSR